MFYFEPTFWLLVSFLLFVLVFFKFGKNFINSKIVDYRKNISQIIDNASNVRHNSAEDLTKLKQETYKIKEICQKITNASITQAEQIESQGRLEIEQYLQFKEKYTNEKIQIFTTQKTNSIKALVLDKSLNLVLKYIAENKDKSSINKLEIQKVLNQICK